MELSVTPAELEQLGSKLISDANNMQAELNSLTTRANPDHCWTGNSAKAYWEYYERWQTGQKQAIEALQAMGPLLQKVAQAFAADDEAAAAAFLG